MGIKFLNKFLKENCNESIKFISLSELSGKKIVVDISIYIYKFVGEESLIENIYLMLSIFKYYNITSVFIFDGKPPPEKKKLLKKRYEDKKKAQNEYNELKHKLDNNETIDENEKHELINSMNSLKKNFIYIEKELIETVKKLIKFYGATYYQAPGEADELCAYLVIKNKVWACLSEDMDIFVYGAQRVIRYLSLLNHTAVLYDQKSILENLKITQKEFREICSVSNNDYNLSENNNLTLYNSFKLFYKYDKNRNNISFYDWLTENISDLKNNDLFKNVYNIFDVTYPKNKEILEKYDNIEILNGSVQMEELREILKKDGFLFP
jgi:5'-3' exonuclease